jgi:hypothetical protein
MSRENYGFAFDGEGENFGSRVPSIGVSLHKVG